MSNVTHCACGARQVRDRLWGSRGGFGEWDLGPCHEPQTSKKVVLAIALKLCAPRMGSESCRVRVCEWKEKRSRFSPHRQAWQGERPVRVRM